MAIIINYSSKVKIMQRKLDLTKDDTDLNNNSLVDRETR